MAIGDAYGDATTYRSIFGTNDATKDADILLDLTSVSRYLDRALGRHFSRDAAAVARTYRIGEGAHLGASARELWIPDVATKTGFAVLRDENFDGSFAGESAWMIDTDFQLLPLDAGQGPEAEPWTRIYIPAWSSKLLWANGQYLQITSAQGWPAIPGGIARGTYQLTGIWRLDSSRATQRIPEAIDAVIQSSPEAQRIVRQLIAGYARPAGPGAAMVFA